MCHIQVHLSRNNIPVVKPPLNHTSLPSMAAIFLATCLMAVMVREYGQTLARVRVSWTKIR